MTLPKHLRPRWRYLAVAVESWPTGTDDVGRAAFAAAVDRAARALLGDPGAADARTDVVEFAVADGVGNAVLRVRRDEVGRARAAVACVTRVAGHSVGVEVVGVSGTLRACRRHLDDPPETERTTVTLGGERRPATVRPATGEEAADGESLSVTLVDCHPPTGSDDEAFTGATGDDVDD